MAVLNIHQKNPSVSERVTIGIGSILPTVADTVERIISEADQALHTAKSQGHNRACLG
ncbi:diguanylate cyclase [Synechocystis salina LEGE 06155]|nr:diguanylate cyclase [Synechocystis salina LEGE 06155]